MQQHPRDRGVISVMAMMFLVIFSALAAAMAIVSQGNLRTADTYQHVNRALAAAETGLKFADYRIGQVALTITTTHGEITPARADQHWASLRDKIITEMGNELHSLESYTLVSSEYLMLGRVPVDDQPNAPTFQLHIQRHPIAGENYDGPLYQRAPYNVGGGENRFTADGEPVSSANPVTRVWVRIRSVGEDGDYARSVQMDFRIDKKVRFAILSRNRVMVGRNVMIEGTLGSRYTMTEYNHGHPVQMRDNFHGLDAELDGWLDSLRDYLTFNDGDGDNRVALEDDSESANLADAASFDRNGDGYVDYYDMFLMKYDTAPDGGDGALTMGEFTGTGGELIDRQLWQLINELKYPPGTEFDWDLLRVKEAGGVWQDASADLSVIDNHDRYAKIAGEIVLKASKSQWESGAAGGPYQNFLEGSIAPDPAEAPLTFEADIDQLAEFTPSNFDTTLYRNMATGDLQAQADSPVPNDPSQPTVFTPAGPGTLESVPYNSPHPYDYYERPVYSNYVFEDVTIPKGTNALFVNCKFIGVTFVETESDNGDPNYNYAGMQNPDGSLKYPDVTATVNGEAKSDTKSLANNVRFHDCTFEGMVASDVPAEFSQARNKVQFTGRTRFDINAPSLTTDQKDLFRKSTILMPQYSLEMGTFTDPTSAAETVRLDGTIIGGVFDIRGQATVDGSLLTTYEPVPGQGPLAAGGNPASFNTTIGYFESAAGDGEAEIPDGGFGKIILRYDPDRALPDGILGPIEIAPSFGTYQEGGGL